MSSTSRWLHWLFWPTAATVVCLTTGWLWWSSRPHRHFPTVNAAAPKDKDTDPDDDEPVDPAVTPAVKTVKPRAGAVERITAQAGSVETDEVQLHSLATGILKTQSVLIGDRVKKDQVLAEIDAPELEMQVKRNTALVKQSEAREAQMVARVAIAKADLEVVKAQIVYAEFDARAASAMLAFRSKQLKRIDDLFRTKSIEEALVDEATERNESAREKENAAKAAIVTARAQALATEAKIQLAHADLAEAKAQVKIAEAELGKAKAMLDYCKISAPFDGIITQRNFYPGATVRAAGEKGNHPPLLTIQRTDLVRVVVYIADNEARYADKDDEAFVELDAFRGMKPIAARISRIAHTEDPTTRLMRVEIDVPNPTVRIRHGMYGKVTIVLDKEREKLSIPRACLAPGRPSEVFVVRDSKAHLVRVLIGLETNDRVMVVQGLDQLDRVILNPPRSLRDGADVEATADDESDSKARQP